jgi:hypothetical protein
MAEAPTPPPAPPWRDVFKDPALIITLWVTGQFFALIIIFSQWPSQMAMEAKQVILQAYVVAFTAAWGYWLGSSSGSKLKDRTIAAQQTPPVTVVTPPAVVHTEPAAHVIQQP